MQDEFIDNLDDDKLIFKIREDQKKCLWKVKKILLTEIL